ncbi:NUDIX domain-containing protein [Candidatus Amesbacteria bacterium]|nr:NUDIX domain-containing protein [Candidatus Amesbacteria bacterium]MBI5412534.1 NUDIX domain-containing protein [Candidatus Peregrinibacteria bacterium]
MPVEKRATTPEGKLMHYSVGALIKRSDKYLLIDRAIPPFGFAGIAGHIDENETPLQALAREVKEFECDFVGEPKINDESKSMGWYTQEQIKKLTLEPVWDYWFKKLGVI